MAASEQADDTRQQTESLLSIQVLRACAAVAVVMEHLPLEFTRWLGMPHVLPDFQIGGAGVNVFFVISGFIIVYSSEPWFGRAGGPQHFILRRLLRIVPLYWTITGIEFFYILGHYHANLIAADASYSWFAASFFFLPYPRPSGEMWPLLSVGWTLQYEMFFYVIFAVAIRLSRRAAVIVTTICFGLIVFAAQVIGPFPNPFGYWSNPLILQFVYGMLIALLFRDGIRLAPWLSYGLILFGVLSYTAISMLSLGGLPETILLGGPAASIVAGCALARQTRQKRSASFISGTLGVLGESSYALYLVHPLTLIAPRVVLRRLGGSSSSPWQQAPWLYAFFLLALSIAAAILVHFFYERPVTRWLRSQIITPRRGTHQSMGDSPPRA